MGLENRDYMRATPGGRMAPRREFARPRPGSVTAWLIFLNVLVYVIDPILYKLGWRYQLGNVGFKPLETWGSFSMNAVANVQLWRFITFQFLHASFDHLLFNMIALFMFGPMVERYLTSRLFLVFYLLCGIGGAVMYVILRLAGLPIAGIGLIGASAGIFGVLIAAARIAPDAIGLLFGFVPIRLRTAAWLFIAYAVFQVLRGRNAGGEGAHLGGAIVGYVLMRYPGVLERIAWMGKRAPPF